MARNNNGIATRDDVNSLGYQKFTITEPDGEPLNRCVPKSLIENDWHYTIYGTYETNQLLKFQDISRVLRPEPEPEPEDNPDCIINYTDPRLVSNTGNPGSFYLAEDGTGVLKVRFGYQVFDNRNGMTYPSSGFDYYANLTSVSLQNDTYFTAWIENYDTLCVSAKTNNVGKTEKSTLATLSVYETGPYGVCSDGFGFEITQVGRLTVYRGSNQRIVYYDNNSTQSSEQYIRANGSNFARIVADLAQYTGKTGQASSSYTYVTTYTNYNCKPTYYYGETNRDWFTLDEGYLKITGPDRGTTTGSVVTVNVTGKHDIDGTDHTLDGYVTVKQEENRYVRREETQFYDQIQIYNSNYGTELSYTGTSDSQYYVNGEQTFCDTSRTVMTPKLIQGVRHYTYYNGYTARIESGIYESSGTASGWTAMSNIEVPSEYQSFATTRVVHVYDNNGYVVEPSEIDAMQPRLIVSQNNSDSKRYFSVNVWAASTNEVNPYKHSLALMQYEVKRVTTEPKVASIGICDGTYPYTAVTSVPASYSGDSHTLYVTARCEYTTTTLVDGRTIIDTQEYTGRTTDSDITKAFLTSEASSTFTIRNWDASADLTPVPGEMLRRDLGSGYVLACRIYPRTTNPGPYDVRNTFGVYYQEGSLADYSSVTVTHLAPGASDLNFTISPTTRNIDERSGTYSFTVGGSTGASWYTATDVSWLHPERTSTTTISCPVDANTDTGTSNRVGHVYVKWNDGSYVEHIMAEATVNQEPDYFFSFTGNTPETISSAATTFVLMFVSRKGSSRINIVNEWVYPESVRNMITTNTVDGQGWQILYFTCGANQSTSPRSWNVEIRQPRNSGTDGLLTVTITQEAKEDTPSTTPADYLNFTWVSLGASQYAIGFTNSNTSNAIRVTKFWYYKVSSPESLYVYSGEPFVVPAANTGASSVTFTGSDPYTVIMDTSGDHRIEAYWVT